MKWSRVLIRTMKENPKEAETTSHRLLLRGGFITQHQSGVYTFLPPGWKIMQKIQNIIRSEMNSIGAQELLMPSLTSGEVWKQSGRWETFGNDMFKFKDRKGKDVALAPTHEEVISLLARDYLHSYRDLPQIWYQLQTKFRDEPRPRGGILRVREFIMKDSYSFDRDWDSLDKSYQLHKDAYSRIFERCGLEFKIVEASSGIMGGGHSEEFMVFTKTGEDSVVICEKCGYAANAEVAEANIIENGSKENFSEKKIVHTPNARSVEDVAHFLDVEPSHIVKSLLYVSEKGQTAMVLIRGDYEINEAKLLSKLGTDFQLASPDFIKERFGIEPGFIGPDGLAADKIIADESVRQVERFVAGSNKDDYHIVGLKLSDIRIDEFADLRLVREGDLCSRCNAPLKILNAIEVGHIFKLGTKYSDSLDVKYADYDGTLKPIIMGSYGIGVGRIMAAAIELFNDEKGIIWPFAIAPYEVNLIEINPAKTSNFSDNVYELMTKSGFDTIWDERNISAGIKFKDAELIGIPINIIISENKAARGEAEIQIRKDASKYDIKVENLVQAINTIIEEKRL
ncbi:MAG TPA: proline--tRNA ligase [Candidatus Hydrothermia bacterium]|nr:proline--tRNA ligase [Candidatus Hydrothermia bacterium]HOK22687.1 proline--tRNA ligase [Candidatus Hydrothermia bacterium]HOL23396.1 proline--tRNA ligase [Candidatus Hydrothermia bacterium]HPO78420.1 proline--tRNA ligase [Candidatus Hydrothermia bacterium]HRD22722.1 proline--tRNA ligase [Candidatus Hydrothermia bacterium]